MLTRGFLGGRRDPEALGLDDKALIEPKRRSATCLLPAASTQQVAAVVTIHDGWTAVTRRASQPVVAVQADAAHAGSAPALARRRG